MDSFWRRVDKSGANGCWNWTSYKLRGRGIFRYKKVTRSCPRWSWFIHYGVNPELSVLHHCDNPSCVNPEHLYLGTQVDNMADMVSRDRSNKPLGEKNGRCKTTVEAVVEIKKLLQQGLSAANIRDLGYGYGLVRAIKSNKNWTHITV